MAADKDKIFKGVRFLAIALPLIFAGPILLVALGIPWFREGNYWWFGASVVVMIVAAFFAVKGLRTVLSGFFDGDQ